MRPVRRARGSPRRALSADGRVTDTSRSGSRRVLPEAQKGTFVVRVLSAEFSSTTASVFCDFDEPTCSSSIDWWIKRRVSEFSEDHHRRTRRAPRRSLQFHHPARRRARPSSSCRRWNRETSCASKRATSRSRISDEATSRARPRCPRMKSDLDQASIDLVVLAALGKCQS